jgi:crotonobetaine/carnitine-CoA ligase
MSSTGSSALRDLPLAEQTIPALLQRQASTHGSRPMLRCGTLERNYIEMRDAVADAAGMLAANGIQRGESVAFLCENRIELLDLILGCDWMGAVAVPLNTALRGDQLSHQLELSGARLLVMDSALIEVLEVVRRPTTLRAVWALDGVPRTVPAGFSIVEAPGPAAPIAAAALGPGDTATILFTSGTTGPSKGVLCPHAQFYWWGVLVGELLEIDEHDVLYTCLPVFHTNALNAFMQALIAGATYHLGPRFSASRFWDQVSQAQATITYLLGAMVAILATRPVMPGDRAHLVTRALAPATPKELFATFPERFGVQLVEAYGSTETNAPISVGWREQRAGSMGVIRDGFHARVADAHDAAVPDGTPGELLLRHDPPFAFASGYVGMPNETTAAWRNLWFHTGDQVVREHDGHFRFVDRLKDAIRRRGENISSFEVEQVLLQHPSVAVAAVFPVASELGEDEVAAALIVRDGHVLDHEELVRYCEPRLAYFAIPRYLVEMSELPSTPNGKVRKAVLRDAGVTAAMWDREAAGVQLRRIGIGRSATIPDDLPSRTESR